ncbi:hypothetical protein NG798_22895 [Ancylothrix sp. C2]|uniref:hypothetical protein n=1 Tax=Ancylothrix sp. D3o TaxID=2953691 RepID=UPI0021BB36FA|nr:hypothetical protein [Ancylothrix sp. D3o]MCT7952650.1 hypothetical protein [Ancylothrix sp. D3o]
MDIQLQQAGQLKQDLIDFVLDAEGELAIALEKFVAEKASKDNYDSTERDILVDTFACEGKAGDTTALELFIESQPDLSDSERHLILNWHRSFTGLFSVAEILPETFDVMNWLTAKHYIIKPTQEFLPTDLKKLKVGDILLARIAPLGDETWIFSCGYSQMGNLGKPKLAVAIGNFKKNYKPYLYSDAPELLEEAWQSVEKYHKEFIDFFGSEEVTLSGYLLSKKITEFQEILAKKSLESAGIDGTKSLAEIAKESGVEEAEIKAAAKAAGADEKALDQMLQNKETGKMVMPKVELPPTLKKAEQVTALSDPRWGQMFLATYSRFKTLLEAADWQTIEGAEKLVRKYLEDPEINAFIWHRLAQNYPQKLESLLREFLNRPEFTLELHLDSLLAEHKKPLEPELPEIASVPIHLHNLFQEAIAELNKSEAKAKANKKPAKGFQRP